MSNRYRLVGLRDEQVLRGVSRVVAQVNALTADMLAHLVEVDSRMLYAELGFPNLFSYCVTSLRLSEGAAGRRCAAARVCRRFPEAFELVAKGELHLSALCALAKCIEPDNAAELFEACRGRSRRRIDELLAARFPRPDAKELIRRNREIEPTSADRYKVQFTADAKLRELIERARALCPDRPPEGELAHVIKRGLELFVARQEKRRFAVGRRPREPREVATKAPSGNAMGAPPGTVPATPPGTLRGTPPGAARRRRAIKPRFGASSMNVTKGVVLGCRRTAGAVQSGRGCSSITSSLGRRALPIMPEIFGCFARTTIGCTRGTALALCMSRPRLRRGEQLRCANRIEGSDAAGPWLLLLASEAGRGGGRRRGPDGDKVGT